MPNYEPESFEETSRDAKPLSLRVLVVEDSEESAKIISKLLEKAGYQVETTRNGTEAITVAKSFLPHAVLVDIGLPGLDGYQVARQIRADQEGALLIATTGLSGTEALRYSEAAGFSHHMVKPLDFDRLIQLIGSAGQASNSTSSDTSSVQY